MLTRRSTVVTYCSQPNLKRTFLQSGKPWRKLTPLMRQPIPKPLEKLKVGTGSVKHPTTPVAPIIRGQEHICPVDVDYMHVTLEDERIGLVLKGIHPKTSISGVRTFLQKHSNVRHCWIHSKGVACVRFQDEECKAKAEKVLREQERYPFHIYDASRRNWLGKPPEDQPPLSIYPLTTSYDQQMPKQGRILVMRSMINLPESIMALFTRYGERERKVTPLAAKFLAHDKWVWEYYLGFPTIEKASKALETYGGKEITIPYRHLTTVDKLHFPYGKTVHLWLRHTGLNSFPRHGTHDGLLKRPIFYRDQSMSTLQGASHGRENAQE